MREGKTPEYKAWVNMISRCYDKRHISYPRYGAKGRTVCTRWRESYAAFLKDMGRKPSPSHSLDRIDSFKDYSPENCRWATVEQQNNNRITSNYLELDGQKMTITQWSRKTGIHLRTLKDRLNSGWSVRDTLTKPTGPTKPVSRYFEFDGKRQTLAQWAKELGISTTTLRGRIDESRWPLERALTERKS